jgi:hypothetical protein
MEAVQPDGSVVTVIPTVPASCLPTLELAQVLFDVVFGLLHGRDLFCILV